MKKLLTALALTLGLLLGGLSLAPAATAADGCSFGVCTPDPCMFGQGDCPPPAEPCMFGQGDCVTDLLNRLSVAEQTANEYRVQVASLQVQVAQQTARADRLQRVADRRAATIQRLRAKIRALR